MFDTAYIWLAATSRCEWIQFVCLSDNSLAPIFALPYKHRVQLHHLSTAPIPGPDSAEDPCGAGLSSLEAAAICANTWYFQGAATAPGSRRCQDDFRLIH